MPRHLLSAAASSLKSLDAPPQCQSAEQSTKNPLFFTLPQVARITGEICGLTPGIVSRFVRESAELTWPVWVRRLQGWAREAKNRSYAPAGAARRVHSFDRARHYSNSCSEVGSRGAF